MSKNDKYRAKRAVRPKAVAARELTVQEKANRATIIDLATTSAMAHSDALENALSAVLDGAQESGVSIYNQHGDVRELVAIVAEIDPDAPAAKKVADALGELLTHKHAAEALEGYRICL